MVAQELELESVVSRKGRRGMAGVPNEPRVSLVSADSTTALVPPPGSIRPGPPGAAGVVPGNEKAPLLHQRRLFRGLEGFRNGLSNSFQGFSGQESGGGYQEFGRSGSSNSSAQCENGGVYPSSSARTLGTFSGVFCPVTLSMFSALVFLRVGFIVGNAGLLETLLQFAIAYAILTFTVFSICAISTNGAVEGGGAYFMISRTLGPEFGGAIGTLFFFANIVSSALYITGCVEGIVDNFGKGGYFATGEGLPNGRWWRFLYCSIINLMNLGVCLIGASLFAKTSVIVLGIVGVSLISVFASYFQHGPFPVAIPEGNDLVNNTTIAYFTGLSSNTFKTNLYHHYGPDYTSSDEVVNFAIVFGVLFSGVTGIMAGANMSGELKVPGKSIPRGTLSAVGFTFIVYILLSILTSATCDETLLKNNYIFMMGINIWGPFVTIGILTATFSASLSNLIGSSRVLEAVAKDDIFGSVLRFVTRGSTEAGNPVTAVLVCFVAVEMFLIIGALNVIAQLNSVLFLLSYFAMNLACLGLELASAPNFRPAFKYFSSHTAFFGLAGTLIMMFIINAIYASVAIIVCLVLVILLHLLTPSRADNWGSISQALIFHQVRKYLLLLDSRKDHVKFWRPHMLLFVANPRSACPLIDFVNDLKKSGLYVLGHVQEGDFDNMEVDPASSEYSTWLSVVDVLKVKAFIEITVARSIREGMHHLIRISGLGAMRPNTIVMGFQDEAAPVDFFDGTDTSPNSFKTDRFKDTFQLRSTYDPRVSVVEYVEMVKDVIKMNKNCCLCRNMALLDKSAIAKNKSMFIDVWPINFFSGDANSLLDPSSLFLLQLGCILNMVSPWKGLILRVFLCCTASSAESSAGREAELRRMLQLLRIKARIVVVPWDSVLARQLPEGFPDDKSVLMESGPQWPLSTIKKDYIHSVNAMLKEHSASTAMTFLYLPDPPTNSGEYPNYLQNLSLLSDGLGPSVYVYGISPVTSTTI